MYKHQQSSRCLSKTIPIFTIMKEIWQKKKRKEKKEERKKERKKKKEKEKEKEKEKRKKKEETDQDITLRIPDRPVLWPRLPLARLQISPFPCPRPAPSPGTKGV